MLFALATLSSGAGSTELMRVSPVSYEPPLIEDGVYKFRLRPGYCSGAIPQGKRLSDCSVDSQRIELIQVGRKYVGEQVLYGWDIFVPKNYSSNSPSTMIASQILDKGRSVVSFYLTKDEGYYVQGNECFPPTDFGEWHRVQVKIRWDATKKTSLSHKTPGLIEIECDSKIILRVDGRPNTTGGPLFLRIGLYRYRSGLDYSPDEVFEASFRNITIERWAN
jgi:hypothetical protein